MGWLSAKTDIGSSWVIMYGCPWCSGRGRGESEEEEWDWDWVNMEVLKWRAEGSMDMEMLDAVSKSRRSRSMGKNDANSFSEVSLWSMVVGHPPPSPPVEDI